MLWLESRMTLVTRDLHSTLIPIISITDSIKKIIIPIISLTDSKDNSRQLSFVFESGLIYAPFVTWKVFQT